MSSHQAINLYVKYGERKPIPFHISRTLHPDGGQIIIVDRLIETCKAKLGLSEKLHHLYLFARVIKADRICEILELGVGADLIKFHAEGFGNLNNSDIRNA